MIIRPEAGQINGKGVMLPSRDCKSLCCSYLHSVELVLWISMAKST